MGEQIKTISKHTLVSIGTAVAIMMVAISFSAKAGALAQKVDNIEYKNSPSRTEFDNMSKRLESIDKGVSDINLYLRSNK